MKILAHITALFIFPIIGNILIFIFWKDEKNLNVQNVSIFGDTKKKKNKKRKTKKNKDTNLDVATFTGTL